MLSRGITLWYICSIMIESGKIFNIINLQTLLVFSNWCTYIACVVLTHLGRSDSFVVMATSGPKLQHVFLLCVRQQETGVYLFQHYSLFYLVL